MKFLRISKDAYSEIFKWREDPFAIKYNPFDLCEFDMFCEVVSNCSSDISKLYNGDNFKWMVLNEKHVLATISLGSINKRMKTAELGYQVNPIFRAQGVGTSLVGLFSNFVFENSDLRKLIAMVADRNIPSCKILEKNGFIKEGLLRNHFIINGLEVDERIYGLLRTDIGRP
jgi:ribosomal-protein-alanine N-acetyltransferase